MKTVYKEGTQLLDYREIIPFQGKLKDLSKENYAKLLASFEKHGFFVPMYIWRNEEENYCLDGHGRVIVLTTENIEFENTGFEIPVVYLEADSISDAKDKLLKITSQYQTITYDGLSAYIAEAELPEVEVYQAVQFDALPLLGEATEEQEVQEDETPEVSKEPAISRLGEVYQLGKHKVYCGDAKELSILMGETKADLLVTDPPYGVSYADKNEFLNSISRGNRNQTKIENDHQTPEEMKEFWTELFGSIFTHLKSDASYYITSPQGGELLLLLSLSDIGFPSRHMIIWAKNNHVLGRCDYNYKHEPLLYGWLEKHKFYGKGKQNTSVWQIDKPHSSKEHPTMKPVELFAECILNSSKEGELVLDPFLGSGTAVIAAEQTKRVCYGSELSPEYVDVIRRRYWKFVNNNDEAGWEENTPTITKA